ncbi:hypothetical protein [Streptomyces sp. NPDC047525]|uniref:hypothetical protein n=1 Tax=Streptomyces sp. NPDC047525 TaxID=3155264 RepID=UPI0034073E13
MKASSAEQSAVIAEIVDAVREVSYWRAGVLMEWFVRDADLGSLCALRTALANDGPVDAWRGDTMAALRRVSPRLFVLPFWGERELP